jgi:hypothetical protein
VDVRGKALAASMTVLAFLVAAATPAFAQDPAPVPAPPAPVPAAPVPAPAPVPVTGGAAYGTDALPFQPTVPGTVGQIVNGIAYAPDQAPDPVKQTIWGANAIIGLPYKYGGGHNARFRSAGYDCSGTVSFALHGGGLLTRPLDSSAFLRWGDPGVGQWITVYSNPGHAFAVVAGIRLDTSAAGDPSATKGPRWRPTLRSTRGYKPRHPVGL